MRVFVSYHRALSVWPAITIQRYLAERGVDVFLDQESISSGRFENVVLNEIKARDHFVLLIAKGTPDRLRNPDDWVAREVSYALEYQKNVIPILLDGVEISEIPTDFPDRERLLAQNALSMPPEYVNEAMAKLYDVFLNNPTIEERNAYLAEEHWTRAVKAAKNEDWQTSEVEVESALRLSQLPEFYLLLCDIKQAQGQPREAIRLIDHAIALDPFGYQLMERKFYLLQEVDQMKDAIHLHSNRGWKEAARSAALEFGRAILYRVKAGDSLKASVDSIGSLSAMHRDQLDGKRQLAVLQDILRFAPDHVSSEIREVMESDPILKYRDTPVQPES